MPFIQTVYICFAPVLGGVLGARSESLPQHSVLAHGVQIWAVRFCHLSRVFQSPSRLKLGDSNGVVQAVWLTLSAVSAIGDGRHTRGVLLPISSSVILDFMQGTCTPGIPFFPALPVCLRACCAR